MTVNDDRAAFAAERERHVLAMGDDQAAFDLSVQALVAADRHRYAYLWTWMGVPIIQSPVDIVTMQELIWQMQPDVIVETGVARGGSVIFSAAMLSLIGKGKVIGVDIDIRAHNRDTIERHPMSRLITLIEGSSIDPALLARVQAEIPAGASVMVVLDSDHSYAHVRAELGAYAPLVTEGQYLVVADTLLGRLTPEQTPKERSHTWLPGDEPLAAVNDFLAGTDRFEPDPLVNGKQLFASSPGGYLRCLR